VAVPEGHEARPVNTSAGKLPIPSAGAVGYILIRIDTRGFGQSPGGKIAALNDQEAQDYYDAIEWAARQPWSNGKVDFPGFLI